MRLHVARAGEGPPVILLHGFPEFWYSWRNQIPALVSAGYSVLAPDLRGYNQSEKPQGVRAYRIDELVADVAGLVAHAGATRSHIVGHDWGGVLAWSFAARNPGMLDRLAVLNAPHPARYRQVLFRSQQWLRSWYVLLFAIPGLAERVLRSNDFEPIRRLLAAGTRRAPDFHPQEVARYIEAIARPGALTAALNYYRAALRYPAAWKRQSRVAAPTLVIWGERDRALVPALADGLERWVPRVQVHRIADAGHWVQQQCPDAVNAALIPFLQGQA